LEGTKENEGVEETYEERGRRWGKGHSTMGKKFKVEAER